MFKNKAIKIEFEALVILIRKDFINLPFTWWVWVFLHFYSRR
ncbi:hypothetical protein PNIG_a0068 [Pseudoalteromonas nigrifaciens]|uniref:Uncharacterized protein n=1 Tax=Pseudoalteromonas nigrifaciens TaxID=28109 RepID=A0AAC9UEV6_9GAMM|nr:hypothetical protein PNIG_a0068 [Pseudoalteromonas nigrifaciens]